MTTKIELARVIKSFEGQWNDYDEKATRLQQVDSSLKARHDGLKIELERAQKGYYPEGSSEYESAVTLAATLTRELAQMRQD